VLHYVAAKRLASGRLTVIDATNVQAEARKPLIALACEYHVLPVAIVLDMPERLCQDRNAQRPDRNFGPHVVRNHTRSLKQSLRGLGREGFRHVFVLNGPDEAAHVSVTREPLYNNKKSEHGPFDIIGDIHGCFNELQTLLERLGYAVSKADSGFAVLPPAGRKAVFLGDLVDRGPNTPDVLRLVMNMVKSGTALCVPGNHDVKLLRKLNGKEVSLNHGLKETMEQLAGEPPEFIATVRQFLDGLVSHYVLNNGHLVVAHAGMRQEMQGRGSGKVRDFALYGETTGETDEFGLPVRYPWAEHYRGQAMVVYGHTPIPQPEWLNNTLNIDTGCVFGGGLTALRYPERELVTVKAEQVYCEPVRPFLPEKTGINHAERSAQQLHDDVLFVDDVLGKRLIATHLHGNVTIREENAIAALEVMSRFAADPKWLIYLPPTMAPTETSQTGELLEHPAQAFAYYKKADVETVVCEEKHMGSRAIVVVCKSAEAARKRFGIDNGKSDAQGICVTRTGRRFFDNDTLESQVITRVANALAASGLWDSLNTDWVLLDCELMPWSAKAQELIRQQYAALGAAATASLPPALTFLEQAQARLQNDENLNNLLTRYQTRSKMADKFVESYRRYCWAVDSINDIRLAPFHLLASEGAVHTDKTHHWHMDTLRGLCEADPTGLLFATPYKTVQLGEEASIAEGTAWWESLTEKGGEGMVVKPLHFVAQAKRGLVQPAVKCRGREYLRIIYGPEYTLPENLSRLRNRNVAGKRSLALREFALGVEALNRFVRREPLRRVHECVFGVLALESEPIDPRL
jgi:polynucleotide kinase-phosphatase